MLKKNLHLCFSSIKCLPTSFSQKPLTLEDEEEEEDNATHGDSMKTFNSLYDVITTSNSTSATTTTTTPEDYWANSEPNEPDLSSVFASQRFFVSSPGPSNSILEYSSAVVDGSVAVRKYSPDPYVDFRRSMEEMVRARREERDRDPTDEIKDGDWEYLHELLFCYLSMNPKHTHKLIVRAFTDLLFSLASTADDGDTVARPTRINGGDGR